MTMSAQSVLQRLVEKIAAAPIDPQPSDNIYMEEVFEPEVYRNILSRMPPRGAYNFVHHPAAMLPDGTPTRLLLELTDITLNRFPAEDQDFWRMMMGVFSAKALQESVLRKFEVKMRERFGGQCPELSAQPIFYRDFPGYSIPVHPDDDVKLATLQFYFPADESQLHLGTSFHLKDGKDFPLYKTNPFKPNSAYAFPRTDTSWHSVQKIGPNESERNTLAWTIYVKGQEHKSGNRYT